MPDQQEFAKLSGDFNPLHVDALRARRTMFGRPLVHGIHLLFSALEFLGSHRPLNLKKCKASFNRGIGVGEPCTIQISKLEANKATVEISLFGYAAAKFRFDFFDAEPVVVDVPGKTYGPSEPIEVPPSRIAGMKGKIELGLDQELLRARFPLLGSGMPLHQADVILATTRLVGMQCPGLNSVYSRLSLEFDEAPVVADHLNWSVAQFDERFGMVNTTIETSSCHGEIDALLRPPPVEQASCAELGSAILPGRFEGRRALVIGGSRGLGEVCAKLLALGGADVLLTYHRGISEAGKVLEDILAHGGKARSGAYNVLDPPEDLAEVLGPDWIPNDIYYYATPYLIIGDKYGFSTEIYESYRKFYVDGFLQLVQTLRRASDDSLNFFYPSSIYVEEPPSGLLEYATTKAEGEALCRYLEIGLRKTRIKWKRLPRINTDLAATMMPVDSADAVESLLDTLDWES